MKKRLLLRIASMAMAGLMTVQTVAIDTNLYVYAKDWFQEESVDTDNPEIVIDAGEESQGEEQDDAIVLDQIEDLYNPEIEVSDQEEIIDINEDIEEIEVEDIDENPAFISDDELSQLDEMIYVRANGIISDDITISWGVTLDYDVASFDVYRNNVKITNIIAKDIEEYSYQDRNLDIDGTYNYQIIALNEEGMAIGKSNVRELCFADDINLFRDNEEYTLTEDMIVNNVSVKYSGNKIHLNGHKLTILGDLTSTSGMVVCFEGGSIECNNLITKDYLELDMYSSSDYILVNGNLDFHSPNRWYENKAGVLEVKGNITDHYNYTGSARDDFKVLLSGYKKQTIDIDFSAKFSNIIELANTSKEGIVFKRPYYASELICSENCKWKVECNDSVEGWTLFEDQVIDGNLNLNGGCLDLNGYTLTIKGNLNQYAGIIDINNGSLIIEGDYTAEIAEGVNEYKSNTDCLGTLIMDDSEDYVHVYGNMKYRSSLRSGDNYTNGNLEVEGNIEICYPNYYDFSKFDDATFESKDNFVLTLSGAEAQNVKTSTYHNIVANLSLKNTKENGLSVDSIYVSGAFKDESNGYSGTVYLKEGSYLAGGNVKGYIAYSECNNITITEDTRISSSVGLYNIKLEGDLYIDSPYANVYGNVDLNGHKIIAKNDLHFQSGSSIIMTNPDELISVGGEFRFESKNTMDACTDGIFEIKGDFICNDYFKPSGNNTAVINGDVIQKIDMGKGRVNAQFNKLVINNTSGEPIYTPNGIFYESIDNQSDTTFTSTEVVSSKDIVLDEDVVIDGDYVLDGHNLNLNGHTFSVKGSLFHKSGNIEIKKGTLEVQGDYVLDGTDLYDVTGAQLLVSNTADNIVIGGDFCIDSSAVCNLNYGTLSLAGDLKQVNNTDIIKSFSLGYRFNLILNGTKKQRVDLFEVSNAYASINNLTINNTSAEGIEFVRPVHLTGNLSQNDKNVSGKIEIGASTNFSDNTYTGDVIFAAGSYNKALTINGNVYLDNATVVLKSSTNKLTINGDLYINDGTITGDYSTALLFVNGNIHILKDNVFVWKYLNINLTGNLLVEDEEKSNSNNYIIGDTASTLTLCGTKKQTIEFVGKNDKVASVVITNTSAEGIYAPYGIHTSNLTNTSNAIIVDDVNTTKYLVLSEDTVIDGDIRLEYGLIDLNGHKLTINGDLIHIGGKLNINAGTLQLNGDYITYLEEDGNVYSNGIVTMNSEADKFIIAGDFIYGMTANSKLSSGLLELKGDFVQKAGVFTTQSKLRTVFSGAEKQSVRFETITDIADTNQGFYSIEVTNKSKDGVCFETYVPVTSSIITNGYNVTGTLVLKNTASVRENYFAGDVIFVGGNSQLPAMTIDGDATFMYQMTTSGSSKNKYRPTYTSLGDINVGGDININYANLTMNGNVYCGGNFDTTKGDGNISFAYSSNSKLLDVDGDFHTVASTWSDVILYVGGDFTLDVPSNNSVGDTYISEVYLDGSEPQHVTVPLNFTFKKLVLENSSAEGVYFNSSKNNATVFVDNGVPVHYLNNDETGFVLQEDMIVDHDMYITCGELDLNGHKLVVNGDLVIENATLNINKGRLEVENDLRFQKALRDSINSVIEYTTTDSYIKMDDAQDYVYVKGSIFIQTINQLCTGMKKGTLELQGDLIQSNADGAYEYGFSTTSVHYDEGGLLLYLTGARKKRIVIYSSNSINIGALKIDEECNGVSANKEVYVPFYFSDKGHRINKNTWLGLNSKTQVDEYKFDCNVTISFDKFVDDLEVNGTLRISGSSPGPYLDGYTIRAKSLRVESPLNIDGGSIIVEGDTTITSYVTMANDTDYFEVGGNLTFNGSYNYKNVWTAGTLLVKGDIEQSVKNNKNFSAQSTHKLILPGKEDGEIQSVSIANTDCKFNEIILYKSIENYSFTPDIDSICKNYSVEGEPVVTVLDTPENLSVGDVTDTTVELSWDSVTDAVAYEIFSGDKKIATTVNNTYVVTKLAPLTEYTYKVRAIDISRNVSVFTEEVKAITLGDLQAPDVPANFVVSYRTGSSICVMWNAASDNVGVAGYEVYRDGSLIATINDAKTLSYKDKNLDLDTTYEYQVLAFDETGNKSELSSAIEAVCEIPTIDHIVPESGNIIGGSSQSVTAYCDYAEKLGTLYCKIEYKLGDGQWNTITTTNKVFYRSDANKTIYGGANWYLYKLADGVYDIRVTVTDEDGYTDQKTFSYVVDKTGPDAPKDLRAICDNGVVKLSWTKSDSLDCTKYKVYRSMSLDGAKFCMSLQEENSFSDTTALVDETYYYWVSGVDEFGQEGALSDYAYLTILDDTVAPSVTKIDCNGKRVNGKASFTATATDNKSVATMSLYYRTDEASEWILDTANRPCVENKASFYFDTTKVADGIVYLKVTARDAAGNDSDNAEKSMTATIVVDNTGISKITVNDVKVYATYVTLTWDNVPDEDLAYFEVYKKEGKSYTRIKTNIKSLGENITGLKPNTDYKFVVVGVDDLGNRGVYSDEVVVKTKNDITAPVVKTFLPVDEYINKNIVLSVTANDDVELSHAIFEYSQDREDWNILAEVKAPAGKQTYNFVKNLDITNLDDGYLYIRVYVYDSVENESSTSDGEPLETYYIIDRTAPDKIDTVNAEGKSGSISLDWEYEKPEDFAGYEIVRRAIDETSFTTIANYVQIDSFTDRYVEYNTSYAYKIRVLDKAGNASEYSEEIFASSLNDNVKPRIYAIVPGNGSLLAGNVKMSVIAGDNAFLKTANFAYRKAGDTTAEWTEVYTVDFDVDAFDEEINFNWDVSVLESGDYEFKAVVTDEDNNASDDYIVKYTVDSELPDAVELRGSSVDFGAKLSWTACESEDFSEYVVYRKNSGETRFTKVADTKETSFSDSNLKAGRKYEYKVAAKDIAGNEADSNVVDITPSGKDTNKPKAFTSSTYSARVGAQITFNGSGSYDAEGPIKEYIWTFGNGDTAKGSVVRYAYNAEGQYSGSLKVVDAAGNYDICNFTVNIVERTSGAAILNILSTDGVTTYRLANSYVYIENIETGEGSNYNADENGTLSVALNPGFYSVSAYHDGYIPNEFSLIVAKGDNINQSFYLEKGELVTGTLTSTRLTIEEMQQLGIDINDSNNWYKHRYEYTVTYPGEITRRKVFVADLVPGKWTYVDEGDGYGSGSGTGFRSGRYITIIEEGEARVVVYYKTTSFLKRMYDVELNVTNHAALGSKFDIVNAVAELKLPNGLSLVDIGTPQSTLVDMQTLSAGETKPVHWYIKADQPGSYKLSAAFNGMLLPFNKEIYTVIEAENNLNISEAEKNTFDDPGFITGEKKSYYIFVKNKRKNAVKGAIVTLYDQKTGKKSQTITNSDGRAILHINKGESRKFKLEITHDGYPDYVNNAYVIEGTKDYITLYKAGEEKNEEDISPYDGEDIVLKSVLLDNVSAMKKDIIINTMLDKQYTLNCTFDSKIAYYSLSFVSDNGGVKNPILSNVKVANVYEISATFSNDAFKSYAGHYNGRLRLEVSDGEGKRSAYDLNIYAVEQMYTFVKIKDGDVVLRDVIKDSYTIHRYKTYTNAVEKLYGDFKNAIFNDRGYEKRVVVFSFEKAPDTNQIADKYELVNGNNIYRFDASNKVYVDVSGMDPKSQVYIVAKKGNEIVSKKLLNILFQDKLVPMETYDFSCFTEPISIDFPDDFPIFKKAKINFFSGMTFQSASVFIDKEGYTHIKLNNDLGNLKIKNTSALQDYLKNYEDGFDPVSTSASAKWGIKIEADLISNVDNTEFSGDVKLTLAGKFSGTVPVSTAGVLKLGVSGSLTADGKYKLIFDENNKKQYEELIIDLILKLGLDVYGGVGCKKLSIGLFGSAELEFLFKVIPLPFRVDTITLSGKLGVRAYCFNLTADFIITEKGPYYLYGGPNNAKNASMDYMTEEEVFASSTTSSNYKYDGSKVKNPTWRGNTVSKDINVFSVIQENVAEHSKPVVINAGGKTVLLFNEYEAGYDVANGSRVAYSVMNSDGTFAAPHFISDSKHSQYSFDAYADENNVYVVYEEANKELATSSSLDEVAAAVELKAAKINVVDESVVSLGDSITHNDKYEMFSNIVSENGNVYVTWNENDTDGIFASTGDNNIMYSKYDVTTSTWSEAYKLDSVSGLFDSLDAGIIDDEVYIAYSSNEKGYVQNLADKNIVNIKSAATNVQFTYVGGEYVLSWYSNGTIYKMAAGAEECMLYDDIYVPSDSYKFVGDSAGNSSIIFTGTAENKSEIYVSDYDSVTKEYGIPNKITSLNENEYIQSPNGAYINGSLLVVYNKIFAPMAENQLVSVESINMGCVYVEKNALISIDDIIYDNLLAIPGGKLPMEISISNIGINTAVKDDVTVSVVNSVGEVVYHQNISENLRAGFRIDEQLEITLPYQLDAEKYTVVVMYKGKEVSKEFIVGYADLGVSAYAELHDGIYSAVAKVRNDGMEAASGTVTFTDMITGKELATESFDELMYDEEVLIDYIIDSSVYDGSKDCYIGVQINTDYHQERTVNDHSEVHLYGMDTRPIYSVTFDFGKADKEAESRYVYENDTVELPEVPAVEGYKFIGWFTASDVQFTSTTPVNDDLLLVARYVEDQATPDPTPAPTPTPDPQPTPAPTPDVPTVDPTVNPFDGYANKVFVGEKKDISGLFANVVKPEGQKLYYRIVDAPVKKMASVSNKGMFLPKKPGKVSVELYYVEKKVGDNGKKTKVKTPLSKVEISILKLGVNESAITATYSGKTVDLNEMMVFNDGTKTVSGNSIIPDIVKDGMTVTYASSNKKVATVDEKGVITVGDKSGKSTIMIKLVTPNKRKINIKVKLTVKIPAFAKKAYSVKVGKTVKTKMKNLVDSNKTGIVYAIADTNIATVDSATGVITGVSIGETEIIATVEGRQYRSTVKVK